MLGRYLRTSEVNVVIYHFQGGVSKYLSKWEHIAAVQKVVYRESVPAQVSMQSLDAWALG